jgi:hypothetical protein
VEVAFSRPVTVSGAASAAPALALSSTGGSSTAAVARWQSTSGQVLRMRYRVLDGHTSPGLDYLSASALTVGDGGGIVGDDGFLALLPLAAPGSAVSLRGSGAVGVNFTVPKPTPDDVRRSNEPSNCGAGTGIALIGAWLVGLLLAGWRRRQS